ncbi:L-threonine 3-dehydrogenase [Neolewinella maritima]|uniref:L-threonine 3-dehydrogenase n=1 Tax=Neolewinella maritima TaxID=1383882 RepID=A0ABM9AYD1_9BACT|nr:NAD(P)-dependent alcohol dehydrogenase [Neolewinella maritima]CAH0999736.1 L-threonine 3-dehydrogenase [Neolewinella maritima]
MKQLRYDNYGGIEQMYLAEVETPTPDGQQVLVQVKAAGINPVDWKIRNAHLKLADGHRWPRLMGCEFAGVVTAAGPGVTDVRIGTEIFGWVNFKTLGAMADYILVDSSDVHEKPASLRMQEAAALPMVGATAYTAMREEIDARGKRILINGGSGGLGHVAVQIARMDNAEVTATGSANNQQFMQDMGATHTVDYAKTDITKSGQTFDAILDAADTLTWAQAKHLLTEHGTFLDIQPGVKSFVSSFVNNLVSDKKHDLLMVNVNHTMLHRLYELVETHGLRVHVGREYALMDYTRAYTELEAGKGPAGKAVLIP